MWRRSRSRPGGAYSFPSLMLFVRIYMGSYSYDLEGPSGSARWSCGLSASEGGGEGIELCSYTLYVLCNNDNKSDGSWPIHSQVSTRSPLIKHLALLDYQ